MAPQTKLWFSSAMRVASTNVHATNTEPSRPGRGDPSLRKLLEATSGGRKGKFTPGAVSANLVGYLPVTDRFSVLGIIGAGWEGGRRRGDVESRNASAGFHNAGLGAAYDVSPNWHVHVQYVNYSKLSWKGSNEASVRSDMITTGVDYRFR
jgi:OOP family OmpA-OmpF porin